MLVVNRPHTNPWFNIAAEEYLLKNMTENCFMLWQNEPAVIVGKHQNTMAEINHRYVKENDLPVIRRISGGGTVFHDLGNLNFSFIQAGERTKLVDFRKFVQPIINVLIDLGVSARFEGKNDIRVNGLKISGNAEHVYKNKVLHHGTLLFESELGKLNNAIKASEENYTDKAVKSVRSTVANISDYLNRKISISEFKKEIIDYIFKNYKDVQFYDLSLEDIRKIEVLSDEKYKTWKWNYAYSPKFVMRKWVMYSGINVEIEMEIKDGIIQAFFPKTVEPKLEELRRLLKGQKLEMESLRKIFQVYFSGIENKEKEIQLLLESLVY